MKKFFEVQINGCLERADGGRVYITSEMHSDVLAPEELLHLLAHVLISQAVRMKVSEEKLIEHFSSMLASRSKHPDAEPLL